MLFKLFRTKKSHFHVNFKSLKHFSAFNTVFCYRSNISKRKGLYGSQHGIKKRDFMSHNSDFFSPLAFLRILSELQYLYSELLDINSQFWKVRIVRDKLAIARKKSVLWEKNAIQGKNLKFRTERFKLRILRKKNMAKYQLRIVRCKNRTAGRKRFFFFVMLCWTEMMLKQLKPVFPNNGIHLKDSGLIYIYIYIYIYAFSRRFYPKRLTVHSGYTIFIYFFISMCVPWEMNPCPFALLMQCSTTEPQEHPGCLHWQNLLKSG